MSDLMFEVETEAVIRRRDGTIPPRWNGAGWEYDVEFTQTV